MAGPQSFTVKHLEYTLHKYRRSIREVQYHRPKAHQNSDKSRGRETVRVDLQVRKVVLRKRCH